MYRVNKSCPFQKILASVPAQRVAEQIGKTVTTSVINYGTVSIASYDRNLISKSSYQSGKP